MGSYPGRDRFGNYSDRSATIYLVLARETDVGVRSREQQVSEPLSDITVKRNSRQDSVIEPDVERAMSVRQFRPINTLAAAPSSRSCPPLPAGPCARLYLQWLPLSFEVLWRALETALQSPMVVHRSPPPPRPPRLLWNNQSITFSDFGP